MTKHTSPPYHVNGLDIGVAVHGRTGLHPVATCSQLADKGLANAEFICRAVNCHDELLRCLREAVEYADSTHVIPSVEMMTAWDAAIEKATPPTVEASAAI